MAPGTIVWGTILWDPLSIFGIDISHSKCRGKAATLNGQRCTRDIPLAKQQEIKRLLETLSRHQPNVAMIDTWLDRLARCMLCGPTHQLQATELVSQWKRNLDVLLDRTRSQYGERRWGWANRLTRQQNLAIEREMGRIPQAQTQNRQPRNTSPQAATRPFATGTDVTDERRRQTPDLAIGEPVWGTANPVEAAHGGELNRMREQFEGQRIEIEEQGTQTAIMANDSPATPASTNPTEGTQTNPRINRPGTTNIPAEATASHRARSLSGECPICVQDVLNGEILVYCQAGCRQWFHRTCIRDWLREHQRCPLCRAAWVEGTDAPIVGASNAVGTGPTVNRPPPASNIPPPAVNRPPHVVDRPPPVVNGPPPIINTPPPAANRPPPRAAQRWIYSELNNEMIVCFILCFLAGFFSHRWFFT